MILYLNQFGIIFGIIIMTTKVRSILVWVGTAGAIISAVAYIDISVVVLGFETKMKMEQQLYFNNWSVAGISLRGC